ncbi:MAG: hypothetical protein AB7E55_01195 [Pigmentiphaga sp.]
MAITAAYWRAVYADGSTYTEMDGPYRLIDRNRLIAFEIVKDGRVVLGLRLLPSQQLIWRKRHRIVQGAGYKGFTHVVGFIDAAGRRQFRYVRSDGVILPAPPKELLIPHPFELPGRSMGWQ